jgi:hypothetical protein
MLGVIRFHKNLKLLIFYTALCEKTTSLFSQQMDKGRRTGVADPPPPGKEGGLKGC